MIVSLFHIQTPEAAIEPFERGWRQRAGMVDKMPGFRGLEVLRDGKTPGKYIVLTHWETKDDYDRWANSPEFVAGHARSGQTGAQGAALEFYEVLVS
ncbi:MAG: antibiotic biosynthesis monooxygenase family protein [Ktedonobacterales bacterium]